MATTKGSFKDVDDVDELQSVCQLAPIDEVNNRALDGANKEWK